MTGRGGAFPPPTWPDNGLPPTDEQLIDWLATFGPDHDPRVAADLLRDRLRQYRAAHEANRATIDRMRHRLDRYRLAWQSAARGRRRERDRARWR